MDQTREKKLIKNTIIIAIGKMSTQIISFLLLPLYTSILATEEYGVYDLIVAIATFIIPLITILMEDSMFRFLIDCKDDKEKKKVITQTTIYVVISSVIFLLIAMIIGNIVKIKYLSLGIVYIITCVITYLRNSLLRGMGKIGYYTGINFITSIIDIILKVIFIAVLRYGVYGLILSSVIANIVTSLCVFIDLKLYKYISIKEYDKKLMKKMVKYSVPLVPNSLSWAIINLSDRVVISSMINTGANGIYSMAYKFPNMMDTIYRFFYTAWQESSARAINDKDKDEFFSNIYIVLNKIMFSASIGMIVCMPLIFNIFIKQAYQDAYLYIPILVIAIYYNNMAGFYEGIFSGYKDTKIIGKTTIIGAVLNIALDLILINFIGIYAAAISTLVSCMFIYFCRKNKVKKYANLKSPNLIRGFIILIMTLICYYINQNIIIKILNLIIVVIYVFILNKDLLFRFKRKIKIREH